MMLRLRVVSIIAVGYVIGAEGLLKGKQAVRNSSVVKETATAGASCLTQYAQCLGPDDDNTANCCAGLYCDVTSPNYYGQCSAGVANDDGDDASPSNDDSAPFGDDTGADDDGWNTGPLVHYCPTEDDFITDAQCDDGCNAPVFKDNGYTITGPGSVGGLASYNFLGGYVSFDFTTSGCNAGVNSNLYTISPAKGVATSGYCDIQSNDSPQCMELDITENNGNCLLQTTWHTQTGTGSTECNEWGCASQRHISNSYTVNTTFSTSGWMNVYINGVLNDNFTPEPDATAAATIRSTMSTIGAALWSSQWVGWVPDDGSCPSYNGGLDSSVFTVANLEVYASVIQGAEPTACA